MSRRSALPSTRGCRRPPEVRTAIGPVPMTGAPSGGQPGRRHAGHRRPCRRSGDGPRRVVRGGLQRAGRDGGIRYRPFRQAAGDSCKLVLTKISGVFLRACKQNFMQRPGTARRMSRPRGGRVLPRSLLETPAAMGLPPVSRPGPQIGLVPAVRATIPEPAGRIAQGCSIRQVRSGSTGPRALQPTPASGAVMPVRRILPTAASTPRHAPVTASGRLRRGKASATAREKRASWWPAIPASRRSVPKVRSSGRLDWTGLRVRRRAAETALRRMDGGKAAPPTG